MSPRIKSLMSLALVAALFAGCGSGRSDKAGGVTAPKVLRIAAHKDDYSAKLFADAVRKVSKHRLRVEFIPGPPDNDSPGVDVRVAEVVREGRYDLGAVGAHTWDELGVKGLEPLQAPLLITDQSLFEAVLASPLAGKMLAGLRTQHVIGLGFVMGQLQHPLGYQHPLATPADFLGKRIHVPLSRVNDAVVSALGGKPVHAGFGRIGKMVLRHEIDGEEMPFYAPPHAWITRNVTLFADAATIVANENSYMKLSDDQRAVLRTAATHAARAALNYWAHNREPKLAVEYCRYGHVVDATDHDLAELRRAVSPVYAQLERDPEVKATIAAIREIKQRTVPDPVRNIPRGCAHAPHRRKSRERDPSFLDGTYRWRITRAGALKVGADPHDPIVGMVVSMTLRGGRFAAEGSNGSRDQGTFKVVGNRIGFTTPERGYTNTFMFKRRADGTLDLKPVLPMEVGDRLFSASAPWKRIGPPVRKVP